MPDEIIDPSRLEAARELVEAEEGPRRKLAGWMGWTVSALAVAMSLLFLYWAWGTVTTQILRLVFLAFTLVLSFLLYPAWKKRGLTTVAWLDWVLILLSLLAVGYALWDFEEFIYRAALPTTAVNPMVRTVAIHLKRYTSVIRAAVTRVMPTAHPFSG